MSTDRGELVPGLPGEGAPLAGVLEERFTVFAPPAALVSVIVPCCGQLEFTRLCVPSLLRHSRSPYELVFVDSGSLDGTADYLAGLAAAASVRVEVVEADDAPVLSATVDEAVARTRGDFVVLLGNDTIVPAGWLDQLVALAQLDPAIGVVGPMSNHATPPQAVGAVPYRAGAGAADGAALYEAVDRFARQWRDQHRGQWFEAERLDGFCLLTRREALRAVLPLGAGPPLAPFDAEALCRKARQAGYRLVGCHDLFVHHFGSRLPAAPRVAPPS